MRIVLLVVELLFALYLGINWGVTHASTAGGKTVLSILAVIAVIVVILVIELIVMIMFGHRNRSGSQYRPASHRWTTEAESADARASYAAAYKAKQAAQATGMTGEEFDAQQAERDAQRAQAESSAYWGRAGAIEPLPPVKE